MSDEIPENLKYATSHEWARLEDENVVRVGITDFAQSELGDLVFIELPEVGKTFAAGEQCAVVESVKSASDLSSPISGTVIDVNSELIDEPELVNDEAYGAWLFCIQATDLTELDKLLDAEAYQQMIEND